ncbi:4Fe-4S binding protein [Prescottella subtropica]|uniref:4Fe-4S binding protein n=1 Tax=Prescottella subtropica TaxID=2545757 RepID=UPI0010F786D3|nr:4Fe-4S binding protein [Prescottella subtropica]
MTHVILGQCCKDASCVRVCPQNCIHPAPGEDGFAEADTLHIDPNSCIDCTACVEACPASAIKAEHALTPSELLHVARNRDYFTGSVSPRVRPRTVVELPLPVPAVRLSVAVVGAGAAAMYTVRELLRRSTSIRVTVYEQDDAVGGLLRRGVSRDHAGVRDMIRLFDVPFRDDRVTVVPRTRVGADVSVDELRLRHDAVILACGASVPRPVGSAGGAGIHQALDLLVAENSGSRPPAPAGPAGVVIGAGNVAFDVVRWIARVRNRSAGTAIRELTVLSRSGPDRAAFTPSALHELLGLDGVDVLVDAAGVVPIPGTDGPLVQSLAHLPLTGVRDDRRGDGALRVVLSFGQEVADLAATDSGGVTVTTAAGRVFRVDSAICATGFTTDRIDGVPLDPRGLVPNDRGRVLSPDTGTPVDGMYVVGWAKRGASGGVGDNRLCAADTVARLTEDLHARV